MFENFESESTVGSGQSEGCRLALEIDLGAGYVPRLSQYPAGRVCTTSTTAGRFPSQGHKEAGQVCL